MPAPGGNYKDTETASRGYASKTTETRGGGGSASGGGRGPSGPGGEARSSPAGNAGGSAGSVSRTSDRGPAGGNSPAASSAARGPSGIGAAARAAGAAMSDSYSRNRGPNFGSLGNLPELKRSMLGNYNPGGSMLNGFDNAGYNALSRANAFGAVTNRERPNVVTQSMVSNYTPYGSPQVMGTGFQNLRNYAGLMSAPMRKDQSRLGTPSFDRYAALRSAAPSPGMTFNGFPQANSFDRYAALRSAGAVPGMNYNGQPPSAGFDKYAALRSAGVVPGMNFNGAMPSAPSRGLQPAPRSFMDQMALNRRKEGLAEYGKRFSQIDPPPAMMKNQDRIPQDIQMASGNPFRQSPGSLPADIRRQVALRMSPASQPTDLGEIRPDPRINPAPKQITDRIPAENPVPINMQGPAYAKVAGLLGDWSVRRPPQEQILSVEDYNGDVVAEPANNEAQAAPVSPSQEYDGPANIAPSQQYDGPVNVAPSQDTGSLGILNDNNSSGGSDNIKLSKDDKKAVEKAIDLVKKGEPITPEMLANMPPEVAALFAKMFPNMAGGKTTKQPVPWSYPTLLQVPYTRAG